jgi:peptidoglycan L-alanyl-D-glutamate endopeptidase CwlK
MNLEKVISRVQRELGTEVVDGHAGPETWGAILRTIAPASARIQGANARVDERSEASIGTLLPELRPYARALVFAANHVGIDARVISGTRSYAEQDALYAQGRTKPGAIVTNARGGYSNHNFGIAFDVGIFEGKKYLGESRKYDALGPLGIQLGLEWGGNWKTFVDRPHYQLRPAWAIGMRERDMLAKFREMVAAGEPIFA